MTTISYLDRIPPEIWRPVFRHVMANFDMASTPPCDLAAFAACLTVCRRWKNLARPFLYENIYVLDSSKLDALADLLSNDADSEAPVAPAIRSLRLLYFPEEGSEEMGGTSSLLTILPLVSRLVLVAICSTVQSAAIVSIAQSSHSTLQTLSLKVQDPVSCWQLNHLRSLKVLHLTSLDCAWQTAPAWTLALPHVRLFEIESESRPGDTVSDEFVRWLGAAHFQREMCELSFILAPMTAQQSTLLAPLFEHHRPQRVGFVTGQVGLVPFLMSCTDEVSFYLSDVAAELFDTGRLPEDIHIGAFSGNGQSVFHSIFQALLRRVATSSQGGTSRIHVDVLGLPFQWSAAGYETTGSDDETQFESRMRAYATQLRQYGIHVLDHDGQSLQPMVAAAAGP